MTITHSDPEVPGHPTAVLVRLVAEIAQADHGLTFVLAPVVVDQPECWFCEPALPAMPPSAVIATVTIIDRFGRLTRRTMCAGCFHDAIVWATSEGREVTIRAAVGAGTR